MTSKNELSNSRINLKYNALFLITCLRCVLSKEVISVHCQLKYLTEFIIF